LELPHPKGINDDVKKMMGIMRKNEKYDNGSFQKQNAHFYKHSLFLKCSPLAHNLLDSGSIP
jgi:hypothetical protein